MKMTRNGANSVTLEWDELRHSSDGDAYAVLTGDFNRATFKGHGRPTRVLYAGYGDDPWTKNPVEAVIELSATGVKVVGQGSFGVAHKFWAKPLAWATTTTPVTVGEVKATEQAETEDTRAVKRAATTRNGKLHDCRCGCGRQVHGMYAQGHDARHVSEVVKSLAGKDYAPEALLVLPTEALQGKAARALAKLAK